MTTTCTCGCGEKTSLTNNEFTELASRAKALSDPIRLRILDAISNCNCGDVCQCDLAELFDITQPTLSHHLHKLQTAGLITSTKQGRACCYQTNQINLKEVLQCLK